MEQMFREAAKQVDRTTANILKQEHACTLRNMEVSVAEIQ